MADSLSKEKNVKKKMSKKRQNFLANPIEIEEVKNGTGGQSASFSLSAAESHMLL